MKLILGILLAVLAGALLAGFLVYRHLRRLAESPNVGALVESFDEGLAIPMRDCDTRRTPKKQP